jgi:hypothetical protein
MLTMLQGSDGLKELSAGLKEMQRGSWQVLRTGRIRVSGFNNFSVTAATIQNLYIG